MPKSDDLKNRLDELFSDPTTEPASPQADTVAGAQSMNGVSFQDMAQAFERAFEHLAIGMIVTDLKGVLRQVNDAFSALLGYTRDEMSGHSFQEFTYPPDHQIGSEAMKAMLAGETRSARFEKRYLRKDGLIVWVELNVTLMLDANRQPLHFMAIAQDISHQRRTAGLLEKRVRELNCLNDIGHKIDEKPPLAEFLTWLSERIPLAFQFPEVCIAVIEYEGRLFGEPKTLQMSSKTVGGLRIGHDLVGWLHVAYTEPRDFVDAESALLGSIVSRVSGYIDSCRIYEQTQRYTEELEILNELGRSTASVLELDQILHSVYQHTGRLMDVTNFFIALYDEESDLLAFPLVYVDATPLEVPIRPPGNGLTEYVIRTGRPLVLSDNVLEQMQRLGIDFLQLGDDEVPLSWVGVPISYNEKTLGIISLQTVEVAGLYQRHELQLLNGLAQQVGKAIALSQQYKALAAQYESVQQSERLVRAIIDASPDWLFVKDREHRFMMVNESFAAAFGHPPKDFIGKSDLEMGYAPDMVMGDIENGKPGYWYEDEKVLESGEDLSIYSQEDRVTGEGRYYDVYKRPLRDQHGQVVGLVSLVRDVTDRARLLQDAESQTGNLTILNEMSRNLATSLDTQHIARTVYEATDKLMQTDSFFIALYDESKQRLNFPLSISLGQPMHHPSRTLAGGLTDYIIRNGEPLLFSENVDEGIQSIGLEMLTYGNDRPALSWLGVPMRYGDRVMGAIVVQSTHVPGLYTERQRDLLLMVASQAANSLALAEQYRTRDHLLLRAEAQGNYFFALNELAPRMNLAESEAEILGLAGNFAQQIEGFGQSSVYLLTPDGQNLAVYNVDDASQPALATGTLIPVDSSVAGQVVRQRSLLAWPHERPVEGYYEAAQMAELGLLAGMNAPIFSSGEPIGTLNIAGEVDKDYDAGDRSLLMQIAAVASAALDNHRLLQRLQSQARREQALREITGRVRSSMAVDAILRNTVRELGDVLGRKTFVRLGDEQQVEE